jgi:leucyl aminopeptidase
MQQQIADLKNVGGKGGGSITAALFLKEFVEVQLIMLHRSTATGCICAYSYRCAL